MCGGRGEGRGERTVVENMDFADDGEEEGEDEHGGRPQVVPQKVEEACHTYDPVSNSGSK
jgi:hypothetical protein